MKIDKATLEHMAELIRPFDTPEMRQAYREGRFPRSNAVKDLNRRYRFDLSYAAKVYAILPDDVTDAHVETALKRIVPDL